MWKSLLLKEWIKWRPFGVLPFFVMLAFLVDYALTQNAILRVHGTVETWVGLLQKEQILYGTLLYVFLASCLFWALLTWIRERVDARVRLTFSLPVSIPQAIGVMTGFGVMWVLLGWGLLYVGMGLINEGLALPREITRPELASLVPWLLAGLMVYAGGASLVLEKHRQAWVGLGLLLYTSLEMLTHPKGWTTFEPTMGLFVLVSVALLLGVWTSFESWRIHESAPAKWGRWALVICATLMWSYSFNHVAMRVFYTPSPKAYINYSPTRDDFVVRRLESQRVHYQTLDGKALTNVEYRESLPFSYRQDLMKWNRFPVAMREGEPLTETEAMNSSWLRLRARDTNARTLDLFALLDREPTGAKLSFSPWVLKVKKEGFEVWDVRSHKRDDSLTQSLQKAVDEVGVVWPLERISANSTPLKAYEAGIWFADAKYQLYRVYLLKDQLHLHKMASLPGLVTALRVEENAKDQPAGLLVSEGQLFMLYDDRIIATAIKAVNPALDDVLVQATPRYLEVTRYARQADASLLGNTISVLTPAGAMKQEVHERTPQAQRALPLIQSVISPLGWTPYTPMSSQALNIWRVDASVIPALLRLLLINGLLVALGILNPRFKALWWTPQRYVTMNLLTLVGGLTGALALWCFTTRPSKKIPTNV